MCRRKSAGKKRKRNSKKHDCNVISNKSHQRSDEDESDINENEDWEQSNVNLDNDTICCVCQNEVDTRNIRKCKSCLKPVHHICGIVDEDDEGYHSRVVCNNCMNKESPPNKIRKKTRYKIPSPTRAKPVSRKTAAKVVRRDVGLDVSFQLSSQPRQLRQSQEIDTSLLKKLRDLIDTDDSDFSENITSDDEAATVIPNRNILSSLASTASFEFIESDREIELACDSTANLEETPGTNVEIIDNCAHFENDTNTTAAEPHSEISQQTASNLEVEGNVEQIDNWETFEPWTFKT